MTLADLVHRARQFVIAVAGTATVLGVALVMAGMAAGFRVEVVKTVAGLGAREVVLASSASAQLTAFTAFPESEVPEVAAALGAHRVSPMLLDPELLAHLGRRSVPINLVGVVPGGAGAPGASALTSGRPLSGPDQVVVDDRLGARLGARLQIGGRWFTVAGTVPGRSLIGGIPLVYISLPVAQQVVLDGRRDVTAVLSAGGTSNLARPVRLPHGLEALPPGAVVDATAKQMAGAVASVRNAEWLMWAVAVIIVAALVYVMALERRRDFAVLKALGSSSSKLFAGLVLEAVVITVVASLFGLLLSVALAPMMSQPVYVPTSDYFTLPLVAVGIGCTSSLAALRRVTGADPASAFA